MRAQPWVTGICSNTQIFIIEKWKSAFSLLVFYSLLIWMSFTKSCTNNQTKDCQMNSIMAVGVNKTVEEVCTINNMKIAVFSKQKIKRTFFKHCYKMKYRGSNAKKCGFIIQKIRFFKYSRIWKPRRVHQKIPNSQKAPEGNRLALLRSNIKKSL